MPFKPLVTAGIESLLNTFLYRSPALKTARSRLLGKVLRVEVKGFSTSLILVFSERQVDVLGEWAGDADCTVIVGIDRTIGTLAPRDDLYSGFCHFVHGNGRRGKRHRKGRSDQSENSKTG